MSHYVPRPGSKTETAFDFLRNQGGEASSIDIAEAVDTDRKNLPAIFAAATKSGVLEPCEVAGLAGYRLTDAAAAREPTKTDTVERKGEMEIRPYLGAMPKPPKATKAPKAAKRRRKATPDVAAAAFRAGEFSDGFLRLEGDSTEIDILTGHAVNWVQINLSPAAAAALRAYLGARP